MRHRVEEEKAGEGEKEEASEEESKRKKDAMMERKESRKERRGETGIADCRLKDRDIRVGVMGMI